MDTELDSRIVDNGVKWLIGPGSVGLEGLISGTNGTPQNGTASSSLDLIKMINGYYEDHKEVQARQGILEGFLLDKSTRVLTEGGFQAFLRRTVNQVATDYNLREDFNPKGGKERRRFPIVALAYGDVDSLKKWNNGFGHEFGNIVLKVAYWLIEGFTRGYDSVHRYSFESESGTIDGAVNEQVGKNHVARPHGDELRLLLPYADPNKLDDVFRRLNDTLKKYGTRIVKSFLDKLYSKDPRAGKYFEDAPGALYFFDRKFNGKYHHEQLTEIEAKMDGLEYGSSEYNNELCRKLTLREYLTNAIMQSRHKYNQLITDKLSVSMGYSVIDCRDGPFSDSDLTLLCDHHQTQAAKAMYGAKESRGNTRRFVRPVLSEMPTGDL